MRNKIRAAVGGIVSAAAVFLILRKVNFLEVAHAAVRANLAFLLAGVAALGIGYWIRAVRWWRMLRVQNHATSLRTAGGVLMVGFAANNVLPLRAGDLLRALAFRTALSVPSSFVIATLALERILDLLSLFFIAVCLFRFGAVAPIGQGLIRLLEISAAVGVTALVLILLLAGQIKRSLSWLLDRCIRELQTRNKMARAITDIIGLFESIRPLELIHLTSLSLAAWLFETLLYVCVARGMHLQVSLIWPCMALLAANFSSIIPSSPGYVGTFHASVVAVLMLGAVDRATSTAYAVVVHALLWSSITAAGALAYLLLREKAAQPVQTSTGEVL